mgnify:CR=1 FL=1
MDEGHFDYLIGTDYSFEPENLNKINLQLELLNMDRGSMPLLTSGNLEERIKLILGYFTYQLDDFSSLSLISGYALNDDSIVMMPGYTNQVGQNFQFNLKTSFYNNEESLFSSLDESGASIKGLVEASLSYTF